MKHNLLFFIILILATKLFGQSLDANYPRNIFNINIISISDFKSNNTFLEKINIELYKYIKSVNTYTNEIDIDNYECIYEFVNNNLEKVFFIIYKDGIFLPKYFLIIIITQNDLKEIKTMNITEVNRRPVEQTPFPIDLPKPRIREKL